MILTVYRSKSWTEHTDVVKTCHFISIQIKSDVYYNYIYTTTLPSFHAASDPPSSSARESRSVISIPDDPRSKRRDLDLSASEAPVFFFSHSHDPSRS